MSDAQLDQLHKERLKKVFSLFSTVLLVVGTILFLSMLFLSMKNTPIHRALAKEESGKVIISKNSAARISWKGIDKAPDFSTKEFKKGFEKAGYAEETFKAAVKDIKKDDTLSLSWETLPLTGRVRFTQIGETTDFHHRSVAAIIGKIIALLLAIGGAFMFRLGFRMKKNITSVASWAWKVRGANKENSNEQDLKDGFKRALKGEFS